MFPVPLQPPHSHATLTNCSKVNGEKAALDFSPEGAINGASFKTFITRMKGDYSKLKQSDRYRLAACFTNIAEGDLAPIMANVRACPLPP